MQTNLTRRACAYLAGPLFSEAERVFNAMLTDRLEDVVEVYLPQRDGGVVSEMIASGVDEGVAVCRVFKRDVDAILQADILIMILDGRVVDEGAAFELGLAFAHAKRCVGVQTDSRRFAPWGNNPMITGALEVVFDSVDSLMKWLTAEMRQSHLTQNECVSDERL